MGRISLKPLINFNSLIISLVLFLFKLSPALGKYESLADFLEKGL